MTKNWAVFWASMAAIALSATAAIYASLGRPWDLGSVGEWVSGVMAGAAIIAALWIANEEGHRSRKLYEENRRADDRREAELSIRDLKAFLAIFSIGAGALKQVHAKAMVDPAKAPTGAKNVLQLGIIDRLQEQLRALNLSRLDPRALDLLLTAQVSITTLQAALELTANATSERTAKASPETLMAPKIYGTIRTVVIGLCQEIVKRGATYGDIAIPWDHLEIEASDRP